MDFSITPEQEALLDVARAFARNEVAPHAAAFDRDEHYPRALAEKMGALGLVGGVIPAQDYDFLYQSGVKGIYGPGTPIPVSAKDVLEQIRAAQAA